MPKNYSKTALNITASAADMTAPRQTVIVFDLDDTLFQETDYVASAYRAIARLLAAQHGFDSGRLLKVMTEADNAFDALYTEIRGVRNVKWMLDIYRTHFPDITLATDTETALTALRSKGYVMGILTEGRPTTQLNKIKALGLNRFMTLQPGISEPRERGGSGKDFALYTQGLDAKRFVSVGDNPAKDFAQPRSLGWTTIALRDHGRNIHPQDFGICRPDHVIDSLAELPALLG